MVHTLRAAYGWTDEEIYSGIRKYGQDWLIEAYQLCVEDKIEEKRWLLQTLPIARTPMSSQGGGALETYTRKLFSYLDSIAPWVVERRKQAIRERLKRPPESRTYTIED
jgi:hypothetical protein